MNSRNKCNKEKDMTLRQTFHFDVVGEMDKLPRFSGTDSRANPRGSFSGPPVLRRRSRVFRAAPGSFASLPAPCAGRNRRTASVPGSFAALPGLLHGSRPFSSSPGPSAPLPVPLPGAKFHFAFSPGPFAALPAFLHGSRLFCSSPGSFAGRRKMFLQSCPILLQRSRPFYRAPGPFAGPKILFAWPANPFAAPRTFLHVSRSLCSDPDPSAALPALLQGSRFFAGRNRRGGDLENEPKHIIRIN